MTQKEAKSENARHVILSYGNNLYHIDKVSVQESTADSNYNAVFRAKRLADNQMLELDFEISQKLYDVLMDYTGLDNPDLLLVLYFDNNDFTWRFVSDAWVRQQISSKVNRYIV
ncbi:MAG: hypothetical protein NWF03_08110 [Candidatus Bathyarchaeota archaeon]|nr:hypothetical protein [Candidatus Bathyarchaeota archaeon]